MHVTLLHPITKEIIFLNKFFEKGSDFIKYLNDLFEDAPKYKLSLNNLKNSFVNKRIHLDRKIPFRKDSLLQKENCIFVINNAFRRKTNIFADKNFNLVNIVDFINFCESKRIINARRHSRNKLHCEIDANLANELIKVSREYAKSKNLDYDNHKTFLNEGYKERREDVQDNETF